MTTQPHAAVGRVAQRPAGGGGGTGRAEQRQGFGASHPTPSWVCPEGHFPQEEAAVSASPLASR